MSSLTATATNRPSDAYNGAAAALSAEANAKHEVGRFWAHQAALHDVRDLLASLDPTAAVPADLLFEAVESAQNVVDFYAEVFSETPNNWAVEIPLSLTAGHYQLAAARLNRALTTSTIANPTTAAVASYVTAWEDSMAIDGLANWPVLYWELKEQRVKDKDLRASNPIYGAASDALEAKLRNRILEHLHGEMLAMAAYQSPGLRAAATETIERDLRPAQKRIASPVQEALVSLDTRSALVLIDTALGEFDRVKLLGDLWVAQCQKDTEQLYDKMAPLWRRLPTEKIRPQNDKRPVVLVFSPHGDDETSKLGALIAKLASNGHRVVVVQMTENSAGAVSTELTDMPSVHRYFDIARDTEMKRAAEELGVSELVMMNFGDSGMGAAGSSHRRRLASQCEPDVVEAISAVIRTYQPTLVLTIQDSLEQAPYVHDDHRMTELCTRQAVAQVRSEESGLAPSYYVATLSNEALEQYHEALGLLELFGPLKLPKSTATTTIELATSDIVAARMAMKAYETQISDDPAALWQWMHPEKATLKRVFPAPEPGLQETELLMGERFAPAQVAKTLGSDVPLVAPMEHSLAGLVR